MKKSSIFFAALICMMMNAVSVFANERVISAEQLPAAAKTFVKKNFPGLVISYAKIDNEFMKTRNEVRLNHGTKRKFVKNGNWRYGNYEVELSNNLDLRFNKNGQLTRVDD